MSVAKVKSVKGAQAPLNVLEGVAVELGYGVEGSQPVNSSELMPSLDESLDAELVEGMQGESEIRSVPIGAALHGERVDRALAELVPEFSRSYLQQLLGQGLVALNGKPISKPAFKVKAGDVVALEMRPTLQSQAFRPEQIPIDVVY